MKEHLYCSVYCGRSGGFRFTNIFQDSFDPSKVMAMFNIEMIHRKQMGQKIRRI